MANFLINTSLVLPDEELQVGHRPPSQPFQPFQALAGGQPSLSTTNNQLAQCAMMQPSWLQQSMQAMFGPPVVPQPSLSMDLTTDSQNTNFNFSANGDFTIQELDTTILSAGFQQSSFGSPILPQMRPPAIHATCSEQGPFSFITQRQVPVDNRSQQPPEATQLEARKRRPKAPTMSAKKWKYAESRIRHLFVGEELSYKDLMRTINKEFGFTAT
jgi:hypothetical protein